MTGAYAPFGADPEVRPFESLEEQARIFASLPEPAERRYLTDVILASKAAEKKKAGDQKEWIQYFELGPGINRVLKNSISLSFQGRRGDRSRVRWRRLSLTRASPATS